MDPEARSARSARTAPATKPDTAAGRGPTETVLIRVPADPDYLAVIRSASAHVGTKLGGTLAEVSDLRLAVDEACGLLLRHTITDGPAAGDGRASGVGGAAPADQDGPADEDGDLECRFVLDSESLRVRLSLRGEHSVRPDADEFGWTILSALVDDIDWHVDGPTVHVEILKRRSAGR